MARLDQLLARNLGRSRREVARLVRAGAVTTLAGDALTDGRLPLDPADLPLELLIRGAPLRVRAHAHILQHKPVGVVTARKDNRHPTAWSLLDGAPLHAELRAVGRLDLDAAGLLFWTTDTPRVHALTHPRRAIERTYHVALARPWTAAPRDREGAPAITLADGSRPRVTALERLEPARCHPALRPPAGTEALATITVRDGAYHEVKRVFAALASHVLLLVRVAHAGVELPAALEAGGWRELDTLPDPHRP